MEHWGLPDPAKYEGSEEEKLEFFRKIRDEIKRRVEELIKGV
jgi:arsenate reductase